MSTEDNKTLIRQAFEDINHSNLGNTNDYFTPDFIYHDTTLPHISNREEYIQLLTGLMAAFTPQLTIQDLIAEGNTAARYTLNGTHHGQWRGVPATGKPVTILATSTYHFVNGKVVEMWQNADTLSLLQQLGAIPAMG